MQGTSGVFQLALLMSPTLIGCLTCPELGVRSRVGRAQTESHIPNRPAQQLGPKDSVTQNVGTQFSMEQARQGSEACAVHQGLPRMPHSVLQVSYKGYAVTVPRLKRRKQS